LEHAKGAANRRRALPLPETAAPAQTASRAIKTAPEIGADIPRRDVGQIKSVDFLKT
jgi:hypothetical protein